MVGQLLRLGPYLIEVPISAMLVLGVGYASGAEAAALTRVMETLIGAAVGVLVNVLFPPAVGTRYAGQAVQRLAEEIAALLEEAAQGLGSPSAGRSIGSATDSGNFFPTGTGWFSIPSVDRSSGDFGLTPDATARWLDDARQLNRHVPRVDRGLTHAEESRRLNVRALGTPQSSRSLRGGLEALELCSVAVRTFFRSIDDWVRAGMPESDTPHADRARTAWAELLADLAAVVRTFGALLRAETAGPRPPRRPHWRTPWIGCAWTGCGTPRSCLWTRASTRTCGRSTAHLSRWSTGCCWSSTSPRTPSCSPGGGPPSCSGFCVPGDCPASALRVERGASIRARARRTAPTGAIRIAGEIDPPDRRTTPHRDRRTARRDPALVGGPTRPGAVTGLARFATELGALTRQLPVNATP